MMVDGYLTVTRNGQPRHPLMLPYDTPLVRWEAPPMGTAYHDEDKTDAP